MFKVRDVVLKRKKIIGITEMRIYTLDILTLLGDNLPLVNLIFFCCFFNTFSLSFPFFPGVEDRL